MRIPALMTIAAFALVACGPSNPGPTGELASVLAFGAYPGGTLVDEWYSTNGGPVPMPGNYGWRDYRTDDTPAKVRTHYEQLARTNGWTLTPTTMAADLGIGGNNLVADLNLKGRSLRVYITNTPGTAGMMGPVKAAPVPEPSPSPSPGATPTPVPTLPPGPWFVRTEGQVQGR